MKNIPFDDLIDYVFNDLSLKKRNELDLIIEDNEFYLDIVDQLKKLKKEFGSKEKLNAFYEEEKEKIRKKIFPD